MPLPAMKYVIKEALSTQSPKLLIVDINAITYCNEETTHMKSVGFTDSIKDGENKTEAIKALGDNTNWENQISFVKYHKNIYNLGTCIKYHKYYELYGENKTILKGYATNPTKISPFGDDKVLDHNTFTDVAEFNDYEKECVNDLLAYCDSIKNDVKILFVRFPRPTLKNYNEWEMDYINAMEKLLIDKGYEFVDFTDYLDEIGIDMLKDYADETHLNHFGAEKFTKYLCEYMLENYDLTINSDLSDWDQCVEIANRYYDVIKQETLNETRKECFEFELAGRFDVYGIPA